MSTERVQIHCLHHDANLASRMSAADETSISSQALPSVASIWGTQPPWPKQRRMALERPQQDRARRKSGSTETPGPWLLMSLTSEPAVIVDLTVVRDVKLSDHRQGQDPPGPFGGAMVLTLMPIPDLCDAHETRE